MLLNFKPQFKGPILLGTKCHTLREPRKDGKVAKIGETLYLYTGLRQAGAQRICRPLRCVRSESIIIVPGERTIWTHHGSKLGPDELEPFTVQDGFSNPSDFWKWWEGVCDRKKDSSVALHLIGWNPDDVRPSA